MNGTVLRIAAGVVLTCFVTTVLFVLKNGVPVFGRPQQWHVASVTVKDLEKDRSVELTEYGDITQACRLADFLSYVPFSSPDERTPPVIVVTYRMDDGTELEASANYETSWWNGKPHVLKEDGVFVSCARVFFPAQGS